MALAVAVMEKCVKSVVLLIFSLAIIFEATAQNNFFTDVPESRIAAGRGARPIVPTRYRTLQLDTTSIKEFFSRAPRQFDGAPSAGYLITLPMPDGSLQRFSIIESKTMEDGLSGSFSDIKTFDGRGVDDPYASVKLDWTPLGFHAMILSVKHSAVFIDPYSQSTRQHYISYNKSDFKPKDIYRELPPEINKQREARKGGGEGQSRTSFGGTLRQYRLAVACTGEYAVAAVGTTSPTKAQTLAAIVTTVNRVNLVYQVDLDIKLILVSSEQNVIFTNANTDPFKGNNTATVLIDESQRVIDSAIGPANYDIGHTFSTGGGGYATVGVVCENGNKARGITGSPTPVGDPYDIDYVAHEMGHEFDAVHTFNSATGNCQGTGDQNSNVEPGSGSTIMAYAGICDANDLQPHSDPYFHAISIDQIALYSQSGTGSSCPTKTTTGNRPPTVNAGNSYTIPKSTFFVLSGSATDPDGDSLTYCWEEMDTGGPFTDWNRPSDNAPLFRSFKPVTTSQRYFPKLSDQINNTTTIGEVLPSYGRTSIFRLTARDNRTDAGGVASSDMNVTFAASAGPFVVTYPNASGISWQVGSFQTVTWSVANTGQAPVSCANVAIELSTDGGLTFPVALVASTPNDGKEEIVVPNNIATTARVRVRAVGNIFYDFSNANFAITAPAQTTFVFNNPAPVSSCTTSNLSAVIKTSGLNNFNTPIAIAATGNPAGSTVSLSAATINPGQTVTVGLNGVTTAGVYNITITGTAGAVVKSVVVSFYVGAPSMAPVLLSPATGASVSSLTPQLTWTRIANANTYTLQLATNAAFTTGSQVVTGLSDSSFTISQPLASGTEYFWRVAAVNSCANNAGPNAVAFNFQTPADICGDTIVSRDVPKIIDDSNPSTVYSVINVPNGGIINDVNVVGLRGKHSYVSDVTVSLFSPSNTSVVLFSEVCGDSQNFNLNFDDQAASGTVTCPPTTGQTVQPVQPLSTFNNENSAGAWTLVVDDPYEEDGGSLDNWGLRICTFATSLEVPVTLATFKAMPNRNNTVTVTWSIIDSVSTDKYIIERSSDSVTFSSIGEVDAGPFSPGMLEQYLYNDVHPTDSVIYYRLKKVNIDGTYSYSPIARVVFVANPATVIVFPNPVSDQLTVRVLRATTNMTMQLVDALGRTYYTSSTGSAAAGQQFMLPVKGLATGVYFLRIKTGTSSTTEKILVH